MKRFDDPEERRRMAETLRLAAEAIEAGLGETFDVRVEPHHHEAFVGRFVAMKKSGAVRVTIHTSVIVDEKRLGGVPKLPDGG